jgi:hypothetical protein
MTAPQESLAAKMAEIAAAARAKREQEEASAAPTTPAPETPAPTTPDALVRRPVDVDGVLAAIRAETNPYTLGKKTGRERGKWGKDHTIHRVR